LLSGLFDHRLLKIGVQMFSEAFIEDGCSRGSGVPNLGSMYP